MSHVLGIGIITGLQRPPQSTQHTPPQSQSSLTERKVLFPKKFETKYYKTGRIIGLAWPCRGWAWRELEAGLQACSDAHCTLHRDWEQSILQQPASPATNLMVWILTRLEYHHHHHYQAQPMMRSTF